MSTQDQIKEIEERIGLTYDEIYEHLSDTYERNRDDLNQSEEVFMDVKDLDQRIFFGGFDSYFIHDSGNNANEALKALKLIGATEAAKILDSAISCFPDGKVPEQVGDREDLLTVGSDSDIYSAELRSLDDQWNKNDEDLRLLTMRFVEKNRNDFEV